MNDLHHGVVIRPNHGLNLLEVGMEEFLSPIDLVEPASREVGVQLGLQSWGVIGKHKGMNVESSRF
jgi:hypothetical protein